MTESVDKIGDKFKIPRNLPPKKRAGAKFPSLFCTTRASRYTRFAVKSERHQHYFCVTKNV